MPRQRLSPADAPLADTPPAQRALPLLAVAATDGHRSTSPVIILIASHTVLIMSPKATLRKIPTVAVNANGRRLQLASHWKTPTERGLTDYLRGKERKRYDINALVSSGNNKYTAWSTEQLGEVHSCLSGATAAQAAVLDRDSVKHWLGSQRSVPLQVDHIIECEIVSYAIRVVDLRARNAGTDGFTLKLLEHVRDNCVNCNQNFTVTTAFVNLNKALGVKALIRRAWKLSVAAENSQDAVLLSVLDAAKALSEECASCRSECSSYCEDSAHMQKMLEDAEAIFQEIENLADDPMIANASAADTSPSLLERLNRRWSKVNSFMLATAENDSMGMEFVWNAYTRVFEALTAFESSVTLRAGDVFKDAFSRNMPQMSDDFLNRFSGTLAELFEKNIFLAPDDAGSPFTTSEKDLLTELNVEVKKLCGGMLY
jgi:hypothetical protein